MGGPYIGNSIELTFTLYNQSQREDGNRLKVVNLINLNHVVKMADHYLPELEMVKDWD